MEDAGTDRHGGYENPAPAPGLPEITMSKIAVIDARKDLADVLNRAAYGKERVVLTRRGKDVAAIVPMDDLAILEAIEDHMDLTESEKTLERVKRDSEETFSLEEVKAKYQAGKRTRKPGKAKQ